MIRQVLEALLSKQRAGHPMDKEFCTLLKEVEAILNNRHLVTIHDDITDLSVITLMPLSHSLVAVTLS